MPRGEAPSQESQHGFLGGLGGEFRVLRKLRGHPLIGPQVGSVRAWFAFHRLSLDGGGRSRGEEGLV